MLDIIICDDNPIHNQFLFATVYKMLLRHDFPGQVVLSVQNAEDLLSSFLQVGHERLYLLDIHLGDRSANGLELAAKIREKDSDAYIIYVTAHREYSLIGYKTKTFDFLVKPLSEQMVENMLLRVFNDYAASLSEEKTLKLKVGSILHNIPYRDVICFEKMRNVLYVHTLSNIFSSYESLKTIADSVPSHFVMCHKSYIVAANKIRSWDKSLQVVTMVNNKKCPVSRRFKGNLAQVLESSDVQ